MIDGLFPRRDIAPTRPPRRADVFARAFEENPERQLLAGTYHPCDNGEADQARRPFASPVRMSGGEHP